LNSKIGGKRKKMTMTKEPKMIMLDSAPEDPRFNCNKFFKPAELYIAEEKIAW